MSSTGPEILFLIVPIDCFVVTLRFGIGVEISAGFGARLVVNALPKAEDIFAELGFCCIERVDGSVSPYGQRGSCKPGSGGV